MTSRILKFCKRTITIENCGKLALSDVKVIEYGNFISTPYCSKLLADLGAEVIKVEEPGQGDPARRRGPFLKDIPGSEQSGLFLYLNTNKLGVTLNIEEESDQETFKKLVGDADILIEDTKPGKLAALGLGYDDLKLRNPSLVMTSITPFGQTGPYKDYEGSDLITWHMGGLGYLTPRPAYEEPNTNVEKEPLRVMHLASFMAGITAAVATMCALHVQRRTGIGQQVDVSQLEAAFIALGLYGAYWPYEHSSVSRMTELSIAPVGFFKCKDGWIFLYGTEEHHWHRFVEIMGNPEWADNEIYKDTYSRKEHLDTLIPAITDWTLRHTKKEIFEAAKIKKIPLSPANSISEMLESKQLIERGFFIDVEHPVAGKINYPGAPYKFSKTPWTIQRPAPLLGQHNEDIEHNWPGDIRREPKVMPEFETVPVTRDDVTEARALPLEGIRVVEIATAWAGPECARMMSDMGAQVIKIENPAQPDMTRRLPPFAEGKHGLNRSGNFATFNIGKKGCVFDLKKPEDIETVKRLIKISDIVIENFAPGVMDRLGLGYSVLKDIKPDLVMVSLSGFGATGPDKDCVAFGQILEAYAGLDSQIGYLGELPRRCGTVVSDHVSGIMAAFAALAALHYRNLTGEGQHIDISEVETLLACMPEEIMEFTINRRVPQPHGNRDTVMAPHGCYRCQGEDKWVAIAVGSDAEWKEFCQAMGKPELLADERFRDEAGRLSKQDELDKIIGEWTTRQSATDVVTKLQQLNIAAAPVYSGEELYKDPHLRAREFFVEINHPEVGKRELPGVFAKLSQTPGAVRSYDPLLGEHTDWVLHNLLTSNDKY